MKIWKILIISLLLTLAISLMPINRSLKTSMECPKNDQSACYEVLPTYGFPITIAEPNIFYSPVSAIEITPLTAIPFALNWIVYFIILEAANLIYKKMRSSTHSPPKSSAM